MSLSEAVEAIDAGHPMVVPTSLLAVAASLETVEDPLHADHSELFDAIEREFPFISLSRFRPTTLMEVVTWSGLLLWVTTELASWTAQGDPRAVRLVAMLALTRANARVGVLWPHVAGAVRGNPQLVSALETVIGATSLGASLAVGAPEWEAELLNTLLSADGNMAWDRVESVLPSVLDYFIPPWTVGEAATALAEIDPSRLERASASKTLLDALAVMSDLPAVAVARLAASTSSDRIRYVAVRRLTARGTSQQPATEPMVASTLVEAARDASRWAVWLRTFVSYPTRFPGFQRPLGLALAQVGQDARSAYVQAVELENSAEARGLVASCLEAFASCASALDRGALWAEFQRRWAEWDFKDAGTLLGPVPSAVDYAIVGYAVENLSDEELQARLADLERRFGMVANAWHESSSDCVAERNRAASRILPFAHAQQVRDTGGAWLTSHPPALPTSSRSEYLDLMFKVR